MVKAVLFDMDGTITDTEKYYNKAWVKAHHECGYMEYTREDALLQRSLNHQDSANLWKERFGEDYDWDKVHDLVTKYVNEDIANFGIDIKPGLAPLLERMKELGIKSAVVTATRIEAAKLRLTKVGLFDSFDYVISASMVEKGKPYPDVYIYACQKLGLDPAEGLAVEDAPNGVKSAVGAGLRTIMVPDLAGPDEETSKLLYACCPSLSDVIEFLDKE